MPTQDYVVKDTSNNKYVSAYTSPTNYAEVDLAHIGLVKVRTQAECNSIATDLNNATSQNRFVVGTRPK